MAFYNVNFTFTLALCTKLTGLLSRLVIYMCNLVLWPFLSIACHRSRGTEDLTGVFSYAILKNVYIPYPCIPKNCKQRSQSL